MYEPFHKRFIIFLCFIIFTCNIFALYIPKDEDGASQRKKMMDYCVTFMGTPYLYGGNTRDGIDCSGLIVEVARDMLGVYLPRTSLAQSKYVEQISRDDLQPGDLVFFITHGKVVSHVGFYIGDNQFIHAASAGEPNGVIISSLSERYWSARFTKAGRFLPTAKTELVINKPHDEQELKIFYMLGDMSTTFDNIRKKTKATKVTKTKIELTLTPASFYDRSATNIQQIYVNCILSNALRKIEAVTLGYENSEDSTPSTVEASVSID